MGDPNIVPIIVGRDMAKPGAENMFQGFSCATHINRPLQVSSPLNHTHEVFCCNHQEWFSYSNSSSCSGSPCRLGKAASLGASSSCSPALNPMGIGPEWQV